MCACMSTPIAANIAVHTAFGLKEQLIFPEIEYDKVDKIRGMDICICTTATTDEEAKELLTLIGAPFHA